MFESISVRNLFGLLYSTANGSSSASSNKLFRDHLLLRLSCGQRPPAKPFLLCKTKTKKVLRTHDKHIRQAIIALCFRTENGSKLTYNQRRHCVDVIERPLFSYTPTFPLFLRLNKELFSHSINSLILWLQPCADIQDFRAHQCAAYNQVPYEGALLTWTPHYEETEPCALTCRGSPHSHPQVWRNGMCISLNSHTRAVKLAMAFKASRCWQKLLAANCWDENLIKFPFYLQDSPLQFGEADEEAVVVAQLASRVQDGTRCRHGSLDMCIDGKCQVLRSHYRFVASINRPSIFIRFLYFVGLSDFLYI